MHDFSRRVAEALAVFGAPGEGVESRCSLHFRTPKHPKHPQEAVMISTVREQYGHKRVARIDAEVPAPPSVQEAVVSGKWGVA